MIFNMVQTVQNVQAVQTVKRILMVSVVPKVPNVPAVGKAEEEMIEDGERRIQNCEGTIQNEECKSSFCNVTSEICDAERSEEMP